jgi:hypothetical protein
MVSVAMPNDGNRQPYSSMSRNDNGANLCQIFNIYFLVPARNRYQLENAIIIAKHLAKQA